MTKLFIILLGFTLSACAQSTFQHASSQEHKQRQAKHFVQEAQSNQEQKIKQSRDFPPDTLYALMLAEIALERQMPDLGLGYYRREAHKTRDPGVIKRALEISSWLEAHQVSLELIALWQEVEPDNPAAHIVMARQQLYFGLLEGSLVSIERVLALGAQFNFDYFNEALPRLNDDERLELLRKLEVLNEKYSGNSQLNLSLAHLYGLLDQRQSALDAAQRARKLDKNDDRPVIMLSELRFNYGHETESLKQMQKGIKKFPESRALRLLYVQSLLKYGKVEKAQEEIENCLAVFPEEYELRYKLALLATEFRLNQVAEKLFLGSIDVSYRREESYFYLSRISESENRYQQAVSYLENIQPGLGFIEARLQMAYILNQQGKFEEALVVLDQAQLQQRDNNGAFFHAQADLLAESGLQEQALTTYSTGISVYPEVYKLRYAKAMLAETMNRLDVVEQELLYIIKREPDNAMALNALGYTLANKTDRYSEALNYIQKAYDISPNDPAIIDSLGWVHYQLGNYDQALNYLRKALALQADHEIAAHLGEVLWVTGLKSEAKRVWDEALVKNQDSKVLKEVMSRFLNEPAN